MTQVNKLFKSPLKVVNIGLEVFYEATKDQGIPSVHVDWRPPAGGNEKLLAILARLNQKSTG
jgi:hypothetical protein